MSRPGSSTSTTRSTRTPQPVEAGRRRIRDYVANLLKLSPRTKRAVQKDYYQRYGTSMRGLMAEHPWTRTNSSNYVHDIDHSPIEPDPALAAAIEQLPGRKFILTNGTRKHADAIVRTAWCTRAFRRHVRYRRGRSAAEAAAATYDKFLSARRDPSAPRCSRISRAISKCRSARHGHGAGRARREATVVPRSLGTGRPRRAACRLRDRQPAGFLEGVRGLPRGLTIARGKPARQSPTLFRGFLNVASPTLPRPSTPPSRRATTSAPATKGAVREAVEDRARPARPRRGARRREAGERQLARQPVAQEGGAAVVPPQRHEPDRRAARRRDAGGTRCRRSSTAGARTASATPASARCRARSCAARPTSRRTSC